MDRDWVQPVIRECAQFPNGEYDDWVDTVTQTPVGNSLSRAVTLTPEIDVIP